MRAAILTQLNQPLTVAELSMPPLGVGQVRVTVEYAAICGAQLGEIDAVKGPDNYLPHLLGHEGVGVVEEIGAGVTTKAVGEWVILHWRPSEGIAAKGPVYGWDGRSVNAGPMACFADECIVSENRLTTLPEGIDHRVAPLFGCALTTAYGVLANDAQVKLGDSVIIFGCGGVGLPLVRMAVRAGAAVVFAVDPVLTKRYAAFSSGADVAFDGVEWAHIAPADVVIDTTGRSDAIEHAYRLTKKTGKTILVGVPRHDDPIRIDSLPLHFGKVLTGSQGGHCVPHEDIPRLARLVRAGKLSLDGLVTHEYPFSQINDALAMARSGEAGRVLLRMDA